MHNQPKKFFTSNGFLTKEGEQFVSDFRYGITQIMSSDEVAEMSQEELYTLQSNMMELVCQAFTKKITHDLQLSAKLEKMTDEEFYTYLHDKYDGNWILHSLEKEERQRLPIADMQQIADETKHIGEEIRKHMIQNGVKIEK